MRCISLMAWLAVSLAGTAGAQTLAERLLASYDGIRTLTCEVRKTTEGPAGEMLHLSRVEYQRPDRIHVENSAPLERRIVADGVRLFYYISGDPKGYSRPIAELDRVWQIELRKVPGTAMDHLLRLEGIPETDLEPTPDFPVRKGYQAEKVFAVLSADAQGRLARIEFSPAADMQEKTGQYDYSDFQEVQPGVWISCLHKVVARLAGAETRETVRVGNLRVNEPIDPARFVAEPFFQGVEFADSFEAIYDETPP